MAYIPKKRTPTKNRLEAQLLEYLSNPDNPTLNRTELAVKVLGYKDNTTLYQHFSPGELSALETQALAIRRTRYAGALSKVDEGILKEGAKGVPGAAKLCYQRFEDWTERTQVEGRITFESVLQSLIDVTPAPAGASVIENKAGSESTPKPIEDKHN